MSTGLQGYTPSSWEMVGWAPITLSTCAAKKNNDLLQICFSISNGRFSTVPAVSGLRSVTTFLSQQSDSVSLATTAGLDSCIVSVAPWNVTSFVWTFDPMNWTVGETWAIWRSFFFKMMCLTVKEIYVYICIYIYTYIHTYVYILRLGLETYLFQFQDLIRS